MTMYKELPEIESELSKMGTSVEGLLSVVRAIGAGVTSTTRFHPKSAPGTYGYHEGTAALRRLLVPVGYEHDEADGQPRTYSTERGVSVIIHAGDENTGADTGREPRSRNSHGEVTERKTKQNDEQLVLPFALANPVPDEALASDGTPALFTWILLFAIVDGTLRAELSLPRSVEAGKVTEWVHRILLPEQPFGQNPTEIRGSNADEGPEDEVAVEWK